MNKIKVLVVDDSALIRNLMSEIINSQRDMETVATAPDPFIAREWLYPGSLGGQVKAFTEQGAKVAREGWNTFRVEAKGDSIKTWMNGEPRAAIKDNMTPVGFIALQVHGVGGKVENEGMKVMWRNIRLMPLAEDQK